MAVGIRADGTVPAFSAKASGFETQVQELQQDWLEL